MCCGEYRISGKPVKHNKERKTMTEEYISPITKRKITISFDDNRIFFTQCFPTGSPRYVTTCQEAIAKLQKHDLSDPVVMKTTIEIADEFQWDVSNSDRQKIEGAIGELSYEQKTKVRELKDKILYLENNIANVSEWTR